MPAPWQPREDGIDERVRADLDAADWPMTGTDGPRRFAVTHDEATAALRHFVAHRLDTFGPYEDAVLARDWAMAHSLLSVPMNLGVLHPLEAVHAAEQAYHDGTARIASVEGFVRQVLGWREYVWQLYWRFGRGYTRRNHLRARTPLPDWWTELDADAVTARCLSSALADVRDRGWTPRWAINQNVVADPARVLGLDDDQVRAVLALAGRAPSLHNTQPWRFRLYPDAIELHGDPTRQLPVADPTGRELRIACGAALFTLRLALLGLGIRPLVSVQPDRARPDLLATVRHGGTKPLTPELRLLRDAVPRRQTNRRPFTDVTVPTPVRHALRRAAMEEGAWLHLVTDPAQRLTLGRLARDAHTRQVHDPAFSAELAAWTGHDGDRDDGVPASAGGPLPSPNQTWVTRDFTGESATGKGAVFETDPLIGVLSVHSDGPREEIRAGQALQRVLLTATVHGVAVSFLSQLVEEPETRERARRQISGTRPPLVVLRMGHGLPAGRAPARYHHRPDVTYVPIDDAASYQWRLVWLSANDTARNRAFDRAAAALARPG